VEFQEAAARLVRIGQRFDARGWVLGTSGNFSVVIDREPLRLAITRSGTHKGELDTKDILEVGSDGTAIGTSLSTGPGIPSAETRLHLEIVAARQAAAVLHTHSIWSTLVSDRFGSRAVVPIEGFEMLKGLAGVASHEHREWIPVLENDQDMARLAAKVGATLRDQPTCHGFLLRRHGLYTWGATVAEAVRHVEIIEFLLESVGRKEAASWRS
jgi:methylthioribulose-1-phosphate dehydratase